MKIAAVGVDRLRGSVLFCLFGFGTEREEVIRNQTTVREFSTKSEKNDIGPPSI